MIIGYFYALILFLTTLIQCVLISEYLVRMFHCGTRWKASTMSLIYKKVKLYAIILMSIIFIIFSLEFTLINPCQKNFYNRRDDKYITSKYWLFFRLYTSFDYSMVSTHTNYYLCPHAIFLSWCCIIFRHFNYDIICSV